MTTKKRVIIVGAGPAGLTAAMELLRSGQATPVVLEGSDEIGGISRTVNFKGYRMDIGGHRFFSKSDWVMNWWREILPIHSGCDDGGVVPISYQNKQHQVSAKKGEGANDNVMLVRGRLSRIYFLRKYFDYPIKLNANTLMNLGFVRLVRIGFSYVYAMAFPRKVEKSLEDFLVNRFGGELYRTFFKDYTEKVWGVECSRISAEWGAQRIKGLSILSALRHAFSKRFLADSVDGQKATQTSLIEKFLYPKLGPGQLWEEVARRVVDGGGEIHMKHSVRSISRTGAAITSVRAVDAFGKERDFPGDAFISTMPVKDLVNGIEPPAPEDVRQVANDLPYRDFITVGLLLNKMTRNAQSLSADQSNMPPDNWIYIQERDVRIGRLQVFNNWSPHLVSDPSKVWLGLEYFCQEGDDLWTKPDDEMIRFAAAELAKIGMIDESDVLDGTVIRVPKTYPAYFGSYSDFWKIREFVDGIGNLFLVGRNGMHRYNNQDHSMLTAKLAAEAIVAGNKDKSAIWDVNVDDEYHEEKK
ncbi:MAG: NAD(P)/FAD-dependent oxidoreductase [Betaproteobacteria bacterium]|nr:NAD(P)/FAD-dependent oxidoreductase [Betaproteobacteria bacterium]